MGIVFYSKISNSGYVISTCLRQSKKTSIAGIGLWELTTQDISRQGKGISVFSFLMGHSSASPFATLMGTIAHRSFCSRNCRSCVIMDTPSWGCRQTVRAASFHDLHVPPTQSFVTVNAWSDDGVVEGVEYADHMLGVQFHPEIDDTLPELFRFLTE
jgi:gamma-glutamyl-gamma-aminobutyrate hydrolase PuuD